MLVKRFHSKCSLPPGCEWQSALAKNHIGGDGYGGRMGSRQPGHLKLLRALSSLPIINGVCRRRALAVPSLAASVQLCAACCMEVLR